MTIAEDMTAGAATVEEVAALLRTLAPQVAALEQGGGDPQVIAALEAQIASMQDELAAQDIAHATETGSLQDTITTLQAQAVALQATIADLEAQLAVGGGGNPPTGVSVTATAWVMTERGGLFATGQVWKWSAFPLDNLTTAYGSGTATIDTNGVLTMQFTAPLATGQYATIVATKQDTALLPHDREIWSGVWNVPVTEVV